MNEPSADLRFTGQRGLEELLEAARRLRQQESEFIDKRGLQELLSVARTKFGAVIAQPGFPRPIPLTDNERSTSVLWVRREVIEYLMSRPRREPGNEPQHLTEARRFRDGKPVQTPGRRNGKSGVSVK